MPASNAAQCCSGRRAASGRCDGCGARLDACGGTCVDLRADASNCGRCGAACAAGQACVEGVCRCTMASCPGCCDGDACLAVGDACGPAATCSDGTLSPRGTCAGNGSCQPGTAISCAPYLRCAGNACASSCASDADCAGDAYCNPNGRCAGNEPDGEPCSHGGQCASGHCVAGVCCDSACAGPCETCNRPGAEGSCTPRADGTTCDDGNGVCDSGSCVPCGGAGEPCCAGSACAEFGCCDPATGRCVAAHDACAGEHVVCDCGEEWAYDDRGWRFTCTRSGVCRPNHAPIAADVSIEYEGLGAECIGVVLTALEADHEDWLLFRLLMLPERGILYFNSFLASEPGVPGPLPPLNDWPRDCYPGCLLNTNGCSDVVMTEGLPRCPGCSFTSDGGKICPEGNYIEQGLCYRPFSSTFKGVDVFTYSAIDMYGIEGPPATVTIEVIDEG